MQVCSFDCLRLFVCVCVRYMDHGSSTCACAYVYLRALMRMSVYVFVCAFLYRVVYRLLICFSGPLMNGPIFARNFTHMCEAVYDGWVRSGGVHPRADTLDLKYEQAPLPPVPGSDDSE